MIQHNSKILNCIIFNGKRYIPANISPKNTSLRILLNNDNLVFGIHSMSVRKNNTVVDCGDGTQDTYDNEPFSFLTTVKYTADSGFQDQDYEIVGELTNNTISHREYIEEADIGKSVNKLGFGSFDVCKKLKSITIPNTVTYIDSRSFFDCISLTEMTIPATVDTFGVDVFWGCSNLKNITFEGKKMAQLQEITNYPFGLMAGCTIHCTDGDIEI